MCTAITFKAKDNYFGRNLDYEHNFGETVTVTPRNFPFIFSNGKEIKNHYALIGMAVVTKGYPLYFDATNEKGLSMAGLNFPENAFYFKDKKNKDNIASFEFIPWILCQCKNITEAKKLLKKINISERPFDISFPPTPLHWIISDKEASITVEQTKKGLFVYDNPVGVLTNNPSFDIQLFNLNNYHYISPLEPENKFSDKLSLKIYSRGMGGIGIPGDFSSMSRFVRACFVKLNSVSEDTEISAVNQFFHILNSVYQPKGCTKIKDSFEITNYTSCCNVDKGIYYYTTYNNNSINAVCMHNENLLSDKLSVYRLNEKTKFNFCN